MAAIFITSFTAAALLHNDTALALLLAGVAMVTLVLAVIGANVRSPRRAGRGHLISEQKQLNSAAPKRRPGD